MIVTYEYYLNDYKGQTMAEAEFDKWNSRAEDDIDNMSEVALDSVESWEEPYLKKAICSQIEYYFFNGETYNSDTANTESLGKYSYSLGGSAGQRSLSPRAKSYLNKTNLLFRGVERATTYTT